jgi:hypothetical protein
MRALARLAAATFVVALLAACAPEGPKFRASDVTGTSFGKDFSLADHNGKPRTLADFRGKVVVLFFGYTHCPDVCPTTLAELAETMKRLGPDADRVQVLFATLDPERDTAELLAQDVPRAPRRRRGHGADRAGVQDLLPEAARADAGDLHDGPLRRELPVRSAGAVARLRRLRPGPGRLHARHSRAAAHRRLAPSAAAVLRAQDAHIARLRAADLALDVLPYGSHTTLSGALWAGFALSDTAGFTRDFERLLVDAVEMGAATASGRSRSR